MVRETAAPEVTAPWYVRTAEYDGIAIILASRAAVPWDVPSHGPNGDSPAQFYVGYGSLPWVTCNVECGYRHILKGAKAKTYEGDDLAAAEAVYAILEAQLLAGELNRE